MKLLPLPHSLIQTGLLPIWAVSFDPGLTTGVAAFDESGKPIWWGEIKETDGLKKTDLRTTIDCIWKIDPKPRLVICEDFIVEPPRYKNNGYSHKLSGSRVIASEVIGIIRSWCVTNKITLVMSLRTNLYIGLKMAGLQMPSNHNNTHVPSAIAHGTWYLATIGKGTAPDGFKLINPKSGA